VPTAVPTAITHDCSNDDSGLPLAKLKVEQRWTSAAVRQPWDVTLVTQLSPSRRVQRQSPLVATPLPASAADNIRDSCAEGPRLTTYA